MMPVDLSNDKHGQVLRRSNSGTLILAVTSDCLIGLKAHSIEGNSCLIL